MEQKITAVLKVAGMSCGGCAANVESILKALPGVESAAVDLGTGRAAVTYRSGETGPEALAEALSGAGYGAAVEKERAS